MIKSIKKTLRSLLDYIPNKIRRWQRERQLSNQRKHYSRADIAADLDKLPIPDGAVVLVHSSLKAIGYVDGGPQAVVDALINSIVERRKGTLLFPTFSIRGTMHETVRVAAQTGELAFDVANTASNLGAVPEAFRQREGVLRSIHPTHSFAALGPAAEQLVSTHHTCGSSFGQGSPMAEMLTTESWLLGLGTNLGNVTMYHCIEEIEDDFPLYVYTPDSPLKVSCRDYKGNLHEMNISAHDANVSRTRIDRPENDVIRDFYTGWFAEHAGLTWHTVCEAKSWIAPANRLYDEAVRLMRDGITIYSTEGDLREKGFQ